MKILIQHDNPGGGAHLFQRTAWANAFNSLGYETKLWHSYEVSPYDAFDVFQPDIFLGQTYNLTESLVKVISERPWMKVGLRAGDWGSQITGSQFDILKSTDSELRLVEQLREETGQPEFLHIHYPSYALDQTHNKWRDKGFKVISLMMAADVNALNGARYVPELECDLGIVSGYWGYKGQIIDKFFLPILNDSNLRVKIFGNQPWGVNQYCGLISDVNVPHLFASSKICPNFSEPHAAEYGFDINERVFKTGYCGAFSISNYVEGMNSEEVFDSTHVMAHSPAEFKDLVYFYLENDEERKIKAEELRKVIIEKHTNFHRVETILNAFGIDEPKIQLYKDAIV